MKTLLPMYTLWRRELVRFYRQRDRVVGALATPLLFWAVIGSGFGQSFRSDTGYLEYLFPGIIVLTVLFTAIFATISIIEDRKEGFLQSVLVAPVPRSSMVLGKILGATSIAIFQACLFFLLMPFLDIPVSTQGILLAVICLLILSFGLSNLGFYIAWRSDSTQGFHAIMNLFLMPMWLLSGAFFPATGAPVWIQWLISLNPLTYGMAMLRHALYRGSPLGEDLPSWNLSVLITLGFAFATFALASFSAGRQSARDLP